MVAHFTMRTFGVNQAFRFFKGIWLHGKTRQIENSEKNCFTSYVRNMFSATIVYKYYGLIQVVLRDRWGSGLISYT